MDTNAVVLRLIGWGSPEYEQELLLRDRVLRRPIGLSIWDDDRSGEGDDVHLGAFLEEKLAAVLVLTPCEKGVFQMRQVAVEEGWRGRGIGGKLVRFAEALALQKGAWAITLHARQTAAGFYKALGYRVTAARPFSERGLPHLAMGKTLRPVDSPHGKTQRGGCRMEKSKVYFTNLRTTSGINLLEKLNKLVNEAGITKLGFQDRYTAIKLHFGEPGNLAYLRPNFTKVIVDIVKENGGKAFVTDCNTLYVGRRKNALDHLDAAYENGYNPFATGCQVIIADGLKGTDETIVPIDGDYVKEAKIGRAITDADIIISLNHFKGHECTGFGGALKNLGMGCGSRAGKMEMHSSGKPQVNQELCVGCGFCARNCAHGAIQFEQKKARINHDKCVGCGRCIGACPVDAVCPANDEANDILNMKISEYTLAVIKDKPNFHINLVIDVSPFCDCHSENDVPIVPDVGMFASFDPVALDVACADACNKQPVVPGSYLDEQHQENDRFNSTHPSTNWRVGIDHAVKLGVGSKEYELIEI